MPMPMLGRRPLLGAGAAAGLGATSIAHAAAAAAAAASAAAPAARDPVVHALNRLAYGPAPGDLDRVRAMGLDAWIDEQLAPEKLALPAALSAQLGALTTQSQSSRDLVHRYRELEQEVRREAESRERRGMVAGANADAMSVMQQEQATEDTTSGRSRREFVTRLAIETAEARLARAIASPRQLEEVMVEFWFDHFNVFDGKGLDKVLVGTYERDAIRPHAMGRFRDLLGATARHPAMLFYLDNWLSVSADWRPRGHQKNPPSGLNENYARELMELHTLGVDGGYTQADVTQLARMFTGWTFAAHRGTGPDIFEFDPERHDNGTKTWLGQTVPPRGQAEGEWALDVLAAHPSTARHLATQLARRFVGDDPSPALVDAVAQAFRGSQGDIRATLRALLRHPAFREAAAAEPQYKTPYEFIVSAVRASGLPCSNPRPLVNLLNQLGQPLYGCPTPDGWKHVQSAWLNPDAVTRRINLATALASGRLPLAAAPDLTPRGRGYDGAKGNGPNAMAGAGGAVLSGSTPPVDAGALLATLGPAITPATRAIVARAPAALQAAMVLGSPDFMHR